MLIGLGQQGQHDMKLCFLTRYLYIDNAEPVALLTKGGCAIIAEMLLRGWRTKS